MDEGCWESGDLGEKPVATVLIEALRRGVTGVLSFEQGPGVARLYLRNGWPSGCQVFQGFKPLGQYLLEEGLIDVDTLGRSLAQMASGGGQHGQVLMQMGAVSPDDLERVLLRQQGDYLARILAIGDGKFRFVAAEDLPPWTSGVPSQSPYRAILSAMQSGAAAAIVEQTVSTVRGHSLVLAPGIASFWEFFSFSEDEAQAVSVLSAPTGVDDFLAASPGVDRGAILAALWQLGMLEVAGAVPLAQGPIQLADVAVPGLQAATPAAEFLPAADRAHDGYAPPEVAAPPEAVAPAEVAAPPAADAQPPFFTEQAPDAAAAPPVEVDWGAECAGDQPPACAVEPTEVVRLASGFAEEAAAPPAGAEHAQAEGQASQQEGGPQQDFVGESLLQAFQGWLADPDPVLLERRLWGLLNHVKSLSESREG